MMVLALVLALVQCWCWVVMGGAVWCWVVLGGYKVCGCLGVGWPRQTCEQTQPPW